MVCKLLTVFFSPLQYGLSWERESINDLIEKAILDADARGVKVLSLGLLNQARNYYFTTLVETIRLGAYRSVAFSLYLLGAGETAKRWW